MNALLDVTTLSVRYGGIHAVDQVSMRVDEGQIVGLIGPNGAGKTTAIDALTGFVRKVDGTVRFAGNDVTGEAPHARARRGMGRTWQGGELFDDLTVLENLQVAADWSGHGTTANLDALARSLGLHDDLRRRPSELSHGHRKLVAVGRAMAASPRLLCLDEPAAGLDVDDSNRLGERLQAIADDRVGILLVDHDMGLVLSICNYIYVLQFGRLIAQGTPAEVRSSDDVLAAYLGTKA